MHSNQKQQHTKFNKKNENQCHPEIFLKHFHSKTRRLKFVSRKCLGLGYLKLNTERSVHTNQMLFYCISVVGLDQQRHVATKQRTRLAGARQPVKVITRHIVSAGTPAQQYKTLYSLP